MNKGMIIRIIVMFIVMVNSIGAMYGFNLIPFTEDEISIGISAVALVISELWNHYKNNNYTPEAKQAQSQLDELKQNRK